MTAIFFPLAMLALLYMPQLWIKHVLKKYSAEKRDIPGNGQQLADYLLGSMNIVNCKVEETHTANHFDYNTNIIRLNGQCYGKKSITALAVAAHEVGHAIQKHEEYRLLKFRHNMAAFLSILNKGASVAALGGPAALPFIKGSNFCPTRRIDFYDDLRRFAFGTLDYSAGRI